MKKKELTYYKQKINLVYYLIYEFLIINNIKLESKY